MPGSPKTALPSSARSTPRFHKLSLSRMVTNFQRSVAEDTVRNSFDFRTKILGWLLASPSPLPLETVNERVYSHLFLTPRSDPWLGLVPADTYSASATMVAACGEGPARLHSGFVTIWNVFAHPHPRDRR